MANKKRKLIIIPLFIIFGILLSIPAFIIYFNLEDNKEVVKCYDKNNNEIIGQQCLFDEKEEFSRIIKIFYILYFMTLIYICTLEPLLMEDGTL